MLLLQLYRLLLLLHGELVVLNILLLQIADLLLAVR